jgi:hypothetical protein
MFRPKKNPKWPLWNAQAFQSAVPVSKFDVLFVGCGLK